MEGIARREGPDGTGAYLLRSDGSMQRIDNGTEVGGWAWSLDGRSLAYFSRPVGADASVPVSLWVMRTDGTERRKLVDFPLGQGPKPRAPVWSPNSQRLAAMTAGSAGGPPGGAWIVEVATGDARQVLTNDELDAIVWSPDSKRIATDPATTTEQSNKTRTFEQNVVVVDPTTGARTDIAHNNDVAAWTPSGDIVMVSGLVTNDRGDEQPHRVPGLVRALSPDGQHLATESTDTFLVYDRNWCGRALVNIADHTGPHWISWYGPSQILVIVNPHDGVDPSGLGWY